MLLPLLLMDKPKKPLRCNGVKRLIAIPSRRPLFNKNWNTAHELGKMVASGPNFEGSGNHMFSLIAIYVNGQNCRYSLQEQLQ